MTRTLAVALALGACGSPVRSTAPLASVTIAYTTPRFGFAICTPTELHACVATIPLRFGTHVTPPVDVATGCLDEPRAEAACPGSPNDASTLRCYAEHGVFFETFGVVDPTLPTSPSHFTLACDEGIAAIDFIEPF